MLKILQTLVITALLLPIPVDLRADLPDSGTIKTTTTTSNGTKIVKHETAGNLEVTTEISCQGFDKLNNKLTPADLYSAISKCFEVDDYDSAAQMFALAGVYSRFDELRVADPTAHQASQVLIMQTFQNLSAEQRKKFQSAIEQDFSPGSDEFSDLCEAVREIGEPDYYPRYMVQHGMRAFGPEQPNKGLLADFDPDNGWESALDTYLHCPKA